MGERRTGRRTRAESGDAQGSPRNDFGVARDGTRVLFLNPEVVVVQDSDLDDLEAFVKTLSQKQQD